MKEVEIIPIVQLCQHYSIELSFIEELHDHGLVEVTIVDSEKCIHCDHVSNVEKIIRLKQELNLNLEGIDVVLNLLDKVETLQNRLIQVENRLRFYED